MLFVIPGTYADSELWANDLPGYATFASALRESIVANAASRQQVDVRPFRWVSSVHHAARVSAAVQLAKEIDTCGQYDRVVLVGHSHGGNVALQASGLCKRRVAMIVCLSTPHIYYQMRHHKGHLLNFPVYQTPEGYRNAEQVVSIVPRSDTVPAVWSQIRPGVTEEDAAALTRDWQVAFEHPVAASGKGVVQELLADVFGKEVFNTSSNVCSSYKLLTTDMNISYLSWVNGVTETHSAAHSRRIGSLVGKVVAAAGSRESLLYVSQYLQTRDSDDGSPIPQPQYLAAVSQLNQDICGWNLSRVTVNVAPGTVRQAKDKLWLNKWLSLQIGPNDGSGRTYTELVGSNGDLARATWTTSYVLVRGVEDRLSLAIKGTLGDTLRCGAWGISGNHQPPDRVESRPPTYWGAEFEWQPVHQ